MSGITVGVDGSHNARRALEWAMTEAGLRKTPLTVVTVNSVLASYWTGQPILAAGDEARLAEIRKAAEDAVADTTSTMHGIVPESVTVSAVNGFPAQVLVNASADSDLLVVGDRGGGGFASLRLGSVSSQVVHHSKCPVVVVPDGRQP